MVIEVSDKSVQLMEFHEVANIFPLIEGQEFDDLVKDIRENGLKQPIWTYQGKIVDGRNRYRACLAASIPPRFQEWDGSGSLVAFTISLNVKRRHLTKSQLAIIAPQIEEQFALEAAERQREAGRLYGENHSKQEVLPNLVKPLAPLHAAEETAKVLDVSKGYVIDAKRIHRDAPELIEHIKGGTLTIPDAKAIAEMPQERRESVVKKAVKKKEEEGRRVSGAVKDAIIEEQVEMEREEIERILQEKPIVEEKQAVKRRIEPDQVWRLGRHLLYCGDSTSDTFIEICRQAQASLAFADPPYNAGVAEWDIDFVWQHDYLIDVSPIVAVTPGIISIQSLMKCTLMPYRWSMAYWINNGMTRGAVGFGNWIYVALFTSGSLYRNDQDFAQVSISSADRDELEHKGRKPLAMMLHLIKLFSEQGQTVIDPFLGTGTTLVVCEQTERVCVGAELKPSYVESIINRWENLTGGEAVLC